MKLSLLVVVASAAVGLAACDYFFGLPCEVDEDCVGEGAFCNERFVCELPPPDPADGFFPGVNPGEALAPPAQRMGIDPALAEHLDIVEVPVLVDMVSAQWELRQRCEYGAFLEDMVGPSVDALDALRRYHRTAWRTAESRWDDPAFDLDEERAQACAADLRSRSCDVFESYADGPCDDVWKAAADLGDPCAHSASCAVGLCTNQPDEVGIPGASTCRRCAPPLEEGDVCNYSSECSEGLLCHALTLEGTQTCNQPLAIGELCGTSHPSNSLLHCPAASQGCRFPDRQAAETSCLALPATEGAPCDLHPYKCGADFVCNRDVESGSRTCTKLPAGEGEWCTPARACQDGLECAGGESGTCFVRPSASPKRGDRCSPGLSRACGAVTATGLSCIGDVGSARCQPAVLVDEGGTCESSGQATGRLCSDSTNVDCLYMGSGEPGRCVRRLEEEGALCGAEGNCPDGRTCMLEGEEQFCRDHVPVGEACDYQGVSCAAGSWCASSGGSPRCQFAYDEGRCSM